jgi:hypothetical protein
VLTASPRTRRTCLGRVCSDHEQIVTGGAERLVAAAARKYDDVASVKLRSLAFWAAAEKGVRRATRYIEHFIGAVVLGDNGEAPPLFAGAFFISEKRAFAKSGVHVQSPHIVAERCAYFRLPVENADLFGVELANYERCGSWSELPTPRRV